MTSPRDTEAGPDQPREPETAASEPRSGDRPASEPMRDEQRARDEQRVRQEQAAPADPGAGWATREEPARATSPAAGSDATTVLPSGARRPAAGRPASPGSRPASAGTRPSTRPVAGRSRRARLTLRRIDPWSVFLFSLVASVFIGIALVVAVAVMYAVLGSLGVTESLNELYVEVTGGDITTDALLTSGRIVGGAAVLAAVNVVFLTLLATLSALLYNLCSSFTGGIELTFGERD